MTSAPRTVLSAELTTDAVTAIRRTVHRRGMTQKRLISRVLQWFADQPTTEQDRILNEVVATPADGSSSERQHPR